MNCAKCGVPNEETNKFCYSCGAELDCDSTGNQEQEQNVDAHAEVPASGAQKETYDPRSTRALVSILVYLGIVGFCGLINEGKIIPSIVVGVFAMFVYDLFMKKGKK